MRRCRRRRTLSPRAFLLLPRRAADSTASPGLPGKLRPPCREEAPGTSRLHTATTRTIFPRRCGFPASISCAWRAAESGSTSPTAAWSSPVSRSAATASSPLVAQGASCRHANWISAAMDHAKSTPPIWLPHRSVRLSGAGAMSSRGSASRTTPRSTTHFDEVCGARGRRICLAARDDRERDSQHGRGPPRPGVQLTSRGSVVFSGRFFRGGGRSFFVRP
jgi:hypothetical protein